MGITFSLGIKKEKSVGKLTAKFPSDSRMWRKGTGLVCSIKSNAPSFLVGKLDWCYSRRVRERDAKSLCSCRSEFFPVFFYLGYHRNCAPQALAPEKWTGGVAPDHYHGQPTQIHFFSFPTKHKSCASSRRLKQFILYPLTSLVLGEVARSL